MQASWNQWNNSNTNYAPSYQGSYSAGAAGKSYQVPPSTTTAASTVNNQYTDMYAQQTATTPQQQWQQWEQYQQRYAQWQRLYGDKFQASMQTNMVPSVVPGANSSFPMMPPLPTNTPVQPPPPNTAPPIDKVESQKRSFEGSLPDDNKKQKTGKNKSETLESLIESEKSFDQQFKDWERSFLQWKEQNANHPDKAQYKEYEAKWERFREQLTTKRESLRKKREAKEAEIAAAVKEANSNVNPTVTQVGYQTSNSLTQSNPYCVAPPNMMFPMPNMYPLNPSLNAPLNPPSNPFMGNFPMYNVPPPTNPQRHLTSGNTVDAQNMKLPDPSSQNPPLGFLSASTPSDKTIPGLGLVGPDRGINQGFITNVPNNSTLFSHNQDLTKPLHTSDDKPFNFPRPNQNYETKDNSNQYSFQNRSRFDNKPPFAQSNQAHIMDRSNANVDPTQRFGNRNFMQNDFTSDNSYQNSASAQNDRNNYRTNSQSFFTPNFNSNKYAKYLEDEYDDSRFRDPEPEMPPTQRNDYGKESFNRSSNYQNKSNFRNDNSYYGRDNEFNKRDFGVSRNAKGGFNRQEFGNDRSKDSEQSTIGPPFNRDNNRFGIRNQFSRGGGGGGSNNRGGFERNKNELNNHFENTENKKPEQPSKPVSLLDLPLMKPPDIFDKIESRDSAATPFVPEPDVSKSLPSLKTRFSDSIKENDKDLDHRSQNNFGIASVPADEIPKVDILDYQLQEPFVPAHVFEYDHISRNLNEDSSFEPIYVFDYSHGKRKPTDLNDLKSKSSVVSEFLTENNEPIQAIHSNQNPWSFDSPKIDECIALPQRSQKGNLNPSENSFDKNQDEEFRRFQNEINEELSNSTNLCDKEMPVTGIIVNEKPTVIPISELLCYPERSARSSKLVIIMRGPPGSGKSYAAKLIKDKEVEIESSAPRILSIDDYFIDDSDAMSEGTKYEYSENDEPRYLTELTKAFKRTVTEGLFPFIIVDSVNEKLTNYAEMYSFAESKGFRVYICEMERNLSECTKRNIHGRSEDDISRIIDNWESTPPSQIVLDISSLLPVETPIEEVTMTEEETTDEQPKNEDEESTLVNDDSQTDVADEQKIDEDEKPCEKVEEADDESTAEEYTSYMDLLSSSKWEKMEQTEEKLDRLDGVSRQKTSTSIREWLQLSDEGDLSWYTANAKTSDELSISKKKRVRWADLEERVAQQKMRDIGFVVGQTDWKRMMDPSFGGDKLTQTKYI